jgi:hypothetical protein
VNVTRTYEEISTEYKILDANEISTNKRLKIKHSVFALHALALPDLRKIPKKLRHGDEKKIETQ